ncbi:MAG: hypothetical protein QM734_16620 [Cyclobacteriaceae bacterium]
MMTSESLLINPQKIFIAGSYQTSAFVPEYFRRKHLLIGYMGDYLTDRTYYFKNSRITPLNRYLEGESPDMFDTQISACIISAFSGEEFLNDVKVLARILILFFFCIINVLAITYIKTRWIALNIVIAFIIFLLLVFGAGALIVYLFSVNPYLSGFG